jgi:hypothetical protein
VKNIVMKRIFPSASRISDTGTTPCFEDHLSLSETVKQV